MAIIFDSLIYDVAVAAIVLGICLYKFCTSTFNYWKDRGVPYLEPVPFFGNIRDQFLGLKGINETYKYMYDQMKNEKFFGFFELRAPVLMIRDPELVEKVLIKDFTHFYDRGIPSDPERDPLSANLSGLEGKTWRNLRYKLTPTFTTGKLKGMFEQICNCGEGLVKFIEEESLKDKAIESKPMLRTFAFEIIASVAFGLKIDKDNEVIKDFRKVVESMMTPNKLQMFKVFALLYAPKLAKKFGIKRAPKGAEDAVMYIVRETLNYRRSNNVKRNDFLQLLLNLQKQEEEGSLNFQKEVDCNNEDDDVINKLEYTSKGKEDNNLPGTEKVFMTDWMIAAQAFVFLTGGLETISSATNFALYCLTQNPEIQKKLQEEIDSVLAHNHNKWSYQAVKDMVYLEQVIQESMRMYPVASFLLRVCTEPYKMPDSTLIVEKGTRVIIPVMGIHSNPQNYESPEVFDPDRFQDNNFKPSGKYLPFGDGPRICIAVRFAVLEVKMIVAKILEQYTVKMSPKTKLPLTFRKKSFILAPENGFWFEFDKRVKT